MNGANTTTRAISVQTAPVDWTRRQLLLPFDTPPRYDPADFIASSCNQDAIRWLDDPACWPAGRLAIWGSGGCGKTHLLHRRAGRTDVLSGPALPPWPVPAGRMVAVDDAELAPDAPLLHLLNSAAEARIPVLLAGRAPPHRWRCALPDLASRLRAMTAIAIAPPDDALLAGLLMRLLADRQITLPDRLLAWLRPRLPRDPESLRLAVIRLDQLAMVTGRPISKDLARDARLAVAPAPEADHAAGGQAELPLG